VGGSLAERREETENDAAVTNSASGAASGLLRALYGSIAASSKGARRSWTTRNIDFAPLSTKW